MSLIKSQQYSQQLEKLFNPDDKSLKIDLNVFKQLCSSHDYRKLIDISSILFKIFLTGNHHLSIRELIGKSVYPRLINQNQQSQRSKQDKIDFFVDGLSIQQLVQLIKQFHQMRKKLKYTVYSARIYQIIEMLRKVLQQISNDKKQELGINLLGDFQIMEEQYQKYITNSIFQSAQFNSKIHQFEKNPRIFLQGKFSNNPTLLKFIIHQITPLLQKSIVSIPFSNHTERFGQISRILKFINNYLIVQYQVQVEISKNNLVETRIYVNKLHKELLSKNHKSIIKGVGNILNQAILCPSSLSIQILLLRVLRRLYFLWEYSGSNSTEHITSRNDHEDQHENAANIVRNPLFLTIRNIALFSEGRDEEIKEAAMLTYKIIQQKNDLEMIALIENCDEIRFLKNSKYYSSKAFAYADEIEKIYQPLELGSLYVKNHRLVQAREVWTFTILVEKPSSLICWQFYLGGYDIRFGIFKTDHLKQLSHEQYEKGIDCKQVLKFEKIQNTINSPNKGFIYIKNGVYRFVFDNSFSMMRSKDIYYSFIHLESNS